MGYQCPKGHDSTDSDYCSECGALIGQSKMEVEEPIQIIDMNKQINSSSSSQEICPDCGTLRALNARFCEVCRHDFQDNKTGVAEAIVASQKVDETEDEILDSNPVVTAEPDKVIDNLNKNDITVPQKLNVLICVDREKVDTWDGGSPIKPDTRDRVFPLDLRENLVGRRSKNKDIYPEIEVNDPGVSHRHLKFTLQPDGSFAALELGSSNGTELNGKALEPGISTTVKAGDELTIGIWTRLKLEAR